MIFQKSGIEKKIYDHVVENQDKIYRLAYGYAKNRDDSLDIVQESIIKAIKYQNNLKDHNSLNTWFYKLLVNTSIDFLRRNKKIVYMEDRDEHGHLEELHVNFENQNIDLYDAMDKLDIKYKSIVMLRYFEDMKLEDIANVLEINENTVKTRLYTALKKLRIELEDVNYEG